MSNTSNPPTRTVYTSDLEPGDVVICGPHEFVRIIHEDINVVRLSPGESFQLDDDPRGVVLPEVASPRYQQIDLLYGGAAEQRRAGLLGPEHLDPRIYRIPDEYISRDALGIARGIVATLREQAGALADALEDAGAEPNYHINSLRDHRLALADIAKLAEFIASRGT